MSELKLCQGPSCHQHQTKDRLKGPKDNKTYQTRRRSSMYYGSGNFCSMNCQADWLIEHIDHALNHFGRITEPKKVLCDQAWYKDYTWGTNNNHRHFLINDLLGSRIPISEQQYRDKNIRTPNNLTQ